MKTIKNNQNGTVNPSAFITKSKQRLKQHNNTVYLNNGDEFEIEFYNPTHIKVLAKIELNGKSIGSGIIIRPGERVFLERYLDDNKKFLFETYDVKGNNSEVKEAIKNNGNVTINFFYETINLSVPYEQYTIPYQRWDHTVPYYGDNQFFYTTSISNSVNDNVTLTCANNVNDVISGDNINLNYENSNKPRKSKKLIETGSVEKGSHSNQTFIYDSTNFYNFSTVTVEWKILPSSRKPMYREDIKIYCGECGSKRKKDSYKFCPNCGGKF